MCAQNKPYVMDYEWIWSGLPRTSVATLRVTLDHPADPCAGAHGAAKHSPALTDFGALLNSYFQSLNAENPSSGDCDDFGHCCDSSDRDDFGHCCDSSDRDDSSDSGRSGGRGGWAVHLRPALSSATQTVLDLIAAGQDSADAMEDAAQYTYQHFKDFPGIGFSWTQLPPERLDYTRG